MPVFADAAASLTSHALRAQAVLNVAVRVLGRAPPAWQLAIEGRSFELGDGLSVEATGHLDRATSMALGWLRDRQREIEPAHQDA